MTSPDPFEDDTAPPFDLAAEAAPGGAALH